MNTKNDDSNLISIIGASGSGKTTLAVGLYATAKKAGKHGKHISVTGNDNARRYLETRQTALEQGHWPDATLGDKKTELQLSLHAGGKKADIVFNDYMGERMVQPNFETVIGKPKAAMILFNPGMPGKICEIVEKDLNGFAARLENVDEAGNKDHGSIYEMISLGLANDANQLGLVRCYIEDEKIACRQYIDRLGELACRFRDLSASGKTERGVSSAFANELREIAGLLKSFHTLGLAEPEYRNKIIGTIKKIAQYLKDNGCVAVAFVVTAHDRLKSDLSGFCMDFERYVSIITAHFEAIQLKCPRFNVTITGTLGDQKHPTLALGESNTALDPFLWLLKRIHARKRLDRFFRIVKGTAVASAVFFVAAVIQWGRSSSILGTVQEETKRARLRLEDAWRTKDFASVVKDLNYLRELRTNELDRAPTFGHLTAMTELKEELRGLDDLWSVRHLSMELDDTDAKIERNPLLLQLGWAKAFDDSVKTAKPEEPNAVSELVALRTKWNDNRPQLEKKWQVAALQRQVGLKVRQLEIVSGDKIPAQLKDGFDFLKSIPRDYPLVDNRDELSARLDAARTNALARYCASITTWDVEDETPPAAGPELKQKLKTDLAGKISEPEFAATEEALLEHQKSARAEWDAYQLPKRTREHENALKTAGANPLPALKSSLLFLESMETAFPTIAKGTALEKRHAIERSRKEALKFYADFLAKWDVNGRKPPEFDGEKLRATIDEAVTSEEETDFALDMEKRFADATERWKQHQKQMVDQFIAQYLSSTSNVPEALNEYMDFRNNNLHNPSLPTLDAKMTSILESRIEALMAEYNSEFRNKSAVWDTQYNRITRMQTAQRRFDELRALCLAMGNPLLDGAPCKSSWVASFADRCVTQGDLKNCGFNAAFSQKFHMTGMSVKVVFDSVNTTFKGLSLGVSIYSRYWNEGEKETMARTLVSRDNRECTIDKSKNGTWYKFWEGTADFYLNPWTDSYFTVFWEDRVDFGFNVKGDFSKNIWPELENDEHYKNGFLDFSARFFGKHDGPDTSGTIYIRILGSFSGKNLNAIYQETRR